MRNYRRANRRLSMQMDYGRKSFLDEQEIRSLAWEIFNNDPQYTDYSESDFGKLGRIEPNWIHDAIDKNVKRYLLEHNIPFHMANVSQISNLIVNNRIITYEKVDGGWLETRKSASRRANRRKNSSGSRERAESLLEGVVYSYYNSLEQMLTDSDENVSGNISGYLYDMGYYGMDSLAQLMFDVYKEQKSSFPNSFVPEVYDRVEVRLEGEFEGFSPDDFRRFVEQHGIFMTNIDTELAYLGLITLYINGDSDLVYDFIDKYED